MGKPGAFLDIDRVTHELRPVEERSRDFDPLYVELDDDARRAQASRCMMCGVAFCQMGASFGKARPSGCPLHNLIPEWNELVPCAMPIKSMPSATSDLPDPVGVPKMT